MHHIFQNCIAVCLVNVWINVLQHQGPACAEFDYIANALILCFSGIMHFQISVQQNWPKIC